MKESMKKTVRTVLGPALRWLSGQLEQLQQGVDAVRSSQELLQSQLQQLNDLNRSLVERGDIETEVIGRAMLAQRVKLEVVEAQQQRLLEKLTTLQEELFQSVEDVALPVADSTPSE